MGTDLNLRSKGTSEQAMDYCSFVMQPEHEQSKTARPDVRFRYNNYCRWNANSYLSVN